MKIRLIRLLQFSLFSIDLGSIALILFVALIVFRNRILYDLEYVKFGLILVIGWALISLICNIYSERNIRSFESFTKSSLHAFFYIILIVTVYLFFFRLLVLSRLFVASVLVFIFLSLLVNRALYFAGYYVLKKKNWMMNKVVIIGYNALSKQLVEYLEENGIDKEVVGFCEEYDNVHELSSYPILSKIGDTLDVCKQFGVTEIYSTISPEQNFSLYKLMRAADDHSIRFRIVPDLRLFYNHQMHIEHLNEIVVITPRHEPLYNIVNRIKKRVLDISISSMVIIFILSWVIPLMSIAIRCESRGPVFFRQPRTGKNQKVFLCLKFRSMQLNHDAHVRQATAKDDRVTRVGRFLRRTSLDEFPQFINVLMGDMSIVGPRPHMLKHTDEYSKLIGKYMVRQFLKPGITGWAQVNGFRGETQRLEQMQKRVDHDLWYMENWSLLLDIKIIIMTVLNTLRGEKNAI